MPADLKKQSSSLKVGLVGYNGKMGMSLQKLIKKNPAFTLTEKAHRKSCLSKWDPKKIKGVIDFSATELCLAGLHWAVQNKKAFVSGTTGLNPKQKKAFQKAGKSIPVFYSENMSEGIYFFSQCLQVLSSSDFQILLEDYHHKDKKDSPSGTALRLKNHLSQDLQKKLKLKSYRRGKEFGTHRVTLKSREEILSFEHKALHREVFSKGALKALQFLIKKKKGFYDVKDLYS